MKISNTLEEYVCEALQEVTEVTRTFGSASFDQLAEEVLELHLSLRGKHKDSPAMELIEVATIATHMLLNRPADEIYAAFGEWHKRHNKSATKPVTL